MHNIHESVIIGDNVSIDCENVKIGKYSKIGNNVKIRCKELIIGDHLYMADNVEIGRGGCTNPESIVKNIKIPVQGGLDPKILLTDRENLKKEILRYLNIFKDHPYVFNLGHGILPETNTEMVEYLVKTVQDY